MANQPIKLNWQAFPFALLCVVAYLLMGFLGNLWHPGWLIFLAIPVYHWGVDCIVHKRLRGLPTFAAAVISLAVYLGIGFGLGAWHPGWVVFFAIPVTASMESFFKGGLSGMAQRKVNDTKEDIRNAFREAGEEVRNAFHSDDKID